MTVDTLFILSSGHSGSTLLDMTLGAHPDGFSLGEISHLDRYIRDDETCTCGRPMSKCPLWSEVIGTLEERARRGARTDVRRLPTDPVSWKARQLLSLVLFATLEERWATRAVRRVAPRLYRVGGSALEVYDIVRSLSGSGFVIDSSKSFPRFRVLRSHRPARTRAIYLTRDGRGVVASLMKDPGYPFDKAVRMWMWGQRYCLRMLAGIPGDTWLRIRYEEICRETEVTLRKACSFLGRDYHPAMVKFRHAEHHNLAGNRMRFREGEGIRESTSWRNSLTPEQLASFERKAGSLNRRLLGSHYEP